MAQSWWDALWNGKNTTIPGSATQVNNLMDPSFWSGLNANMGSWLTGMQGYQGQAAGAAGGITDYLNNLASQTGNLTGQMGGYTNLFTGLAGQGAALGANASAAMGNVVSQYNPFQSLFAGLGAEANGLSSAYGQDMGGLASDLSGYRATFGDLADRMAGYDTSFSNLAQTIQNATNNQLSSAGSGGPEAFMRAFQSWQPALQQMAQGSTDAMFGEAGTTSAEYAAEAARRAREDAATQMANSGLLSSGAALNTITESGVEQQLKAASDLAALRGQYGTEIVNTLYGQGMSGLRQSYADYPSQLAALFGAQSNALGGGLEALQAAQGSQQAGAGTVTELMNQLTSQYGNQLQGLQLQGQMGQQGVSGLDRILAGLKGQYDVGANALAGQQGNYESALGTLQKMLSGQTDLASLGVQGSSAQASVYQNLANMLQGLYGEGLTQQGQYNQPIFMADTVQQGTGLADILTGLMPVVAGALTGGAGAGIGGLLQQLFGGGTFDFSQAPAGI